MTAAVANVPTVPEQGDRQSRKPGSGARPMCIPPWKRITTRATTAIRSTVRIETSLLELREQIRDQRGRAEQEERRRGNGEPRGEAERGTGRARSRRRESAGSARSRRSRSRRGLYGAKLTVSLRFTQARLTAIDDTSTSEMRRFLVPLLLLAAAFPAAALSDPSGARRRRQPRRARRPREGDARREGLADRALRQRLAHDRGAGRELRRRSRRARPQDLQVGPEAMCRPTSTAARTSASG